MKSKKSPADQGAERASQGCPKSHCTTNENDASNMTTPIPQAGVVFDDESTSEYFIGPCTTAGECAP